MDPPSSCPSERKNPCQCPLLAPLAEAGAPAASLALRASARFPMLAAQNHSNQRLQRALNTVRWAMSSELTPEISITFRKTRAEVAEISLRRVMHPLLFRTASTV
jgi:hypothetical protein